MTVSRVVALVNPRGLAIETKQRLETFTLRTKPTFLTSKMTDWILGYVTYFPRC